MTGDVVVDNQQHRICKMKGRLIHDVTFGGGLLGRLKERSSFALEQQQVGPSVWELTAIHVHLEGNALLFKSVSLQQDDKRSRFRPEPDSMNLDAAATTVMTEPHLFGCKSTEVATNARAGCVEPRAEGTAAKPSAGPVYFCVCSGSSSAELVAAACACAGDTRPGSAHDISADLSRPA